MGAKRRQTLINMSSTASSPAVVFTDWDGTVTLQDSNDYLTENLGFGRPRRLEVNDEILNGNLSFKDGFQQMLDSIPTPFPECIEFLLANIQLDPGFKTFYEWSEKNGIPVVVVSSGMKPIIKALLEKLVGKDAVEKIEIISNDVRVEADGSWDIIYKHPDSSFGHDKARSIKQYLAENGITAENQKLLFYCGDGVSDLSAAKETNLLFAKHGKDLIKYCNREGIPYTEFNNFGDILRKITDIITHKGANISKYIENH